MRIKKAALLLMIGLMVIAVSSCEINTPQKTLKAYFKALNTLEFTPAGEILGNSDIYTDLVIKMNDQSSYFEYTLNNNFIKFIYSNMKYELVTINQNGDACQATVKITAYNINDVSDHQQKFLNEYMNSPDYLKQNIGERYLRLCEYVPKIYKEMSNNIKAETIEIKLDLVKQNAKWSIVPTKDLFRALAGGAENIQN